MLTYLQITKSRFYILCNYLILLTNISFNGLITYLLRKYAEVLYPFGVIVLLGIVTAVYFSPSIDNWYGNNVNFIEAIVIIMICLVGNTFSVVTLYKVTDNDYVYYIYVGFIGFNMLILFINGLLNYQSKPRGYTQLTEVTISNGETGTELDSNEGTVNDGHSSHDSSYYSYYVNIYPSNPLDAYE